MTYTGYNVPSRIFFKAVESTKESPSTITQPISDLAQTGYNEFQIYRFSIILPKVEETERSPFGFLALCDFFPETTFSKFGSNVFKIRI